MNLTPKNITVPADTPARRLPGYYEGFVNGYQDGFIFAVDKFQTFILLILGICVAFLVIRFIVNRIDYEATFEFMGDEITVNSRWIMQQVSGTFYTIILAITGFLLYYMVV